MKKWIGVAWMLVLTVYVHAQELSNITTNLPEGAKSLVLSADIDRDGLPDVFIAGETATDDFAAIYQNKGDSTFFDLGIGIHYLSYATATYTDLNNDNYTDLIYTGIDESFNYYFYIYINQQDNTFIELSHSIPGIRFGAVQCQDFNHDGWNDIFISGYSSSGNIAKLYTNNGDLTFSDCGFSFDGLRNCDITIADFDHNGYPDIIYTGLNESLQVVTCYYQNQGDMQFVKKTNSLPAAQLGGIESCDVDNDGFTDIAVFGKDNDDNHITKFYKNNNGLSFTLFDELTGIREGALKTADFNNDGYTDIILTGSDETDTYTTALYINNSGTEFVFETDTLTDLGYSDALWFDFNADQKNDLLICGTTLSASKSLLLSSNMAVANQNPQENTGLLSEVSGDTVKLSWNQGIDNETASDGLTYDIYFESDQTDDFYFYPLADLATGYRYLIANGVLSVDSLEITGLPDGKYWWSVQSVDAGYLGSPFAEADTFYISQPVDLGEDTAVCYADSIEFSLEAIEGSVEWYRSTNSSSAFSNAKTVKIEIRVLDTVWVEVTKPYGDILYDTVIVHMNTLPEVNLGADVELCYGTELNLSLGTDTDTVDWFTFTGNYQANNTNQFNYQFFENDEIYAELTDVHACTNSDTLLVTVLPLPEINLVNDTALCLNNQLELNIGTASDSINWYSLADGNQTLNSNTYSYLVIQNDTVQVEWYNENGCINYDTVTIYARQLPDTDAGEDKLICSGYDVTIGPESVEDSWTYFWHSSEQISDTGIANPVVHPTTDSKFYLTVTDQFECVGTDSMQVNINPVGTLNAGVDDEICIGESITLGGDPTAEGSILPYAYLWSPAGSLDNTNVANPVATPTESTTYSVIIFTGDCPVDTLETMVSVNPLPEIAIMNDTLAGFNEDIVLSASGGTDYEWIPADYLDNPYVQNPVASVEQTTLFAVRVTDENGCSDTASVTIEVKNEVFVPELFTPNNDGMNDFFKVYGFGIEEITLIIYNEFGEIVFESSNPDEVLNTGWNGENKGNPVPSGKYFWKIDGHFYSGDKILFEGKDVGVVTILR